MEVNKVLELIEEVQEDKYVRKLCANKVYWSESRGEWVPIGEMDILHFLRAAFKHMPADVLTFTFEELPDE